MGIGHAWGYLNSGEAPSWRNGAWVYESKGTWPVTIGNVVVGDREWLYNSYAYSGSQPSLNSSGQPASVAEHEYGHIPQSETLGFAYGPAVLTSYLVGGAWGVVYNQSLSSFSDSTHRYSLFDNESGFNDIPDYR